MPHVYQNAFTAVYKHALQINVNVITPKKTFLTELTENHIPKHATNATPYFNKKMQKHIF